LLRCKFDSEPNSPERPAGQVQDGTQRTVTIMAGAIQSWTRTLTIDF